MTKHVIALLMLFVSASAYAVSTVTLDANGYVTEEEIEVRKSFGVTKEKGFSGLLKVGTHKRVFGDYLRSQITDSSPAEYRRIGQVNRYCSGTMIGPKHFLTAAHCVYSRKNKSWMGASYFVPGRTSQYTNPFGGADWQKIYILKEYITSDNPFMYDFAVVELRTEIGNKVGWAGYGHDPAVTSPRFTIIGYPGDKPQGTMWEVECPGRFVGGNVTHRCDTYGGMSGSGIIITDSDGNELVSGVHTFGAQEYNGGKRIDAETFRIIKAWKYASDDYSTRQATYRNGVEPRDFDKIVINNACHKEIYFALHYLNFDDEWTTKAWYKIKPGARAYIEDTRNTIIYTYARTVDGTQHWPGSKEIKVGDKVYPFAKSKNDSPVWGIFSRTFKCSNK